MIFESQKFPGRYIVRPEARETASGIMDAIYNLGQRGSITYRDQAEMEEWCALSIEATFATRDTAERADKAGFSDPASFATFNREQSRLDERAAKTEARNRAIHGDDDDFPVYYPGRL